MSAIQKGVIVYNNHPINFLAEMICLTDMWKAAGEPSGRAPSDWRDLTATQTFVDFLTDSGIAGISGNEIFRTIRGGKKPGTWAHWQIAFAYAKYLSPEFHVWVNQAAREKILAISGKTSDEFRTKQPRIRKPSVLPTFKTGYGIAKLLGYDDNQAAIYGNRYCQKKCNESPLPDMGLTYLEAPTQQRTMTATQVAEALNLPGNQPGMAANNLMEAAGLQTFSRNRRNKKVWTPTEKGMPFARLCDVGKEHSDGAVPTYQWLPSVLDVLRLHLATVAEAPPFAKKPEAVS
ncbi:DNA-binding protein, KilA-N domain [Acetobacter phage phiAX1]|nr:DNA-binding protein, KilA-N domain [Acetobacter phage phiAX1]